jgi:hypothetical protein
MRYGRLYVASFENVTVSASQDLFALAPATNKPVVLHSYSISNVGGAADAGDAQEELLRITLVRGNSTVGSGGTTTTPVPTLNADTAFGGVCRINDTTVATAGTAETFVVPGWNVRMPAERLWAPEDRPVCTAAQTRICLRLLSTPADALSVSGELVFEEIG